MAETIDDKVGNPTMEKAILMRDFAQGKIPHNEIGKRLIEIDDKYTPAYVRVLEGIGIFLGLRPIIPYNEY